MINIAALPAFLSQLMMYWQAIMAIMAMFGARTPAQLKAAADDLAKAHAAANQGNADLQATLTAMLPK